MPLRPAVKPLPLPLGLAALAAFLLVASPLRDSGEHGSWSGTRCTPGGPTLRA